MTEENDERQKIMEAKKIQEQIKANLRIVLEESAYERIVNVSHVNKELYLAAAKYVLTASKQAGRRITEEELLSVLKGIKAQTEKETNIKFHKK